LEENASWQILLVSLSPASPLFAVHFPFLPFFNVFSSSSFQTTTMSNILESTGPETLTFLFLNPFSPSSFLPTFTKEILIHLFELGKWGKGRRKNVKPKENDSKS